MMLPKLYYKNSEYYSKLSLKLIQINDSNKTVTKNTTDFYIKQLVMYRPHFIFQKYFLHDFNIVDKILKNIREVIAVVHRI